MAGNTTFSTPGSTATPVEKKDSPRQETRKRLPDVTMVVAATTLEGSANLKQITVSNPKNPSSKLPKFAQDSLSATTATMTFPEQEAVKCQAKTMMVAMAINSDLRSPAAMDTTLRLVPDHKLYTMTKAHQQQVANAIAAEHSCDMDPSTAPATMHLLPENALSATARKDVQLLSSAAQPPHPFQPAHTSNIVVYQPARNLFTAEAIVAPVTLQDTSSAAGSVSSNAVLASHDLSDISDDDDEDDVEADHAAARLPASHALDDLDDNLDETCFADSGNAVACVGSGGDDASTQGKAPAEELADLAAGHAARANELAALIARNRLEVQGAAPGSSDSLMLEQQQQQQQQLVQTLQRQSAADLILFLSRLRAFSGALALAAC